MPSLLWLGYGFFASSLTLSSARVHEPDLDQITTCQSQDDINVHQSVSPSALIQRHTATTSGNFTARKIAYVKTHSTGSSTMTGILHRFCENRRQRCAVQGLDAGRTVSASELKEYTSMYAGDIDVWPNHVVFDPDTFERLLPGSFKVSLFREPLSRVVSSYAHGENPSVIISLVFNMAMDKNDETGWGGCGPAGELMSGQVPLDTFSQLDFVMLTEQYDLSLVMLQRALGWDLEDLLYIRLKDHRQDEAEMMSAVKDLKNLLATPEAAQTKKLKEFLEKCAGPDEQRIYKLAQEAFQRQFDSFTPDEQKKVTADVSHLQAANRVAAECCGAFAGQDAYCDRLLEDNVEWTRRSSRGSPPTRQAEESFCRKQTLEALGQ